MKFCKGAGLAEAHGMLAELAADDILRGRAPSLAEHACGRVFGKFYYALKPH